MAPEGVDLTAADPDRDREARALVVGAGAIGSVLAGALWRAGAAVEVLTKPAEAADAIAREGIRVEGVGVGRPFTARPRASADAADLTPGPDFVFLVTKAMHVVEAAREVLPLLDTDTPVVAMQNGCCDELVAGVVGRERTVGCVVQWGATLVRPGLSRRTSRGGFTLGALDGRAGPGAHAAARMLAACGPVRVTDNILGVRWSKLVVNSCLTTLGAVSGMNLRGVLASRTGRQAFLRTATEAIDVARALGVKLEPMDGLDVHWLYVHRRGGRANAALARAVNEMALAGLALLRGGIVSSSLQSLRRGEPTEIDYLNGHIVARAREVGVEVPVNGHLVGLVKEIERGRRAIGRRNLVLPQGV